MVLHVELENVKPWVLRDALVEVSETQILFHRIGLKRLVYKHGFVLYPEIPPTYIRAIKGGEGGKGIAIK